MLDRAAVFGGTTGTAETDWTDGQVSKGDDIVRGDAPLTAQADGRREGRKTIARLRQIARSTGEPDRDGGYKLLRQQAADQDRSDKSPPNTDENNDLTSNNGPYVVEYKAFTLSTNDKLGTPPKIVSLKAHIAKDYNSEKVAFIRDAVEATLGQHFRKSGISEAEKEDLIFSLTAALLEPTIAGETRWADAITAERAGQSRSAVKPHGEAPALPDAAPAIWKNDKLAGDTPPDFIKRHYGPWLRGDALGLARPDIKRLDPTLYTALANWLKKNQLPEDCPVPNKSAKLDAELELVAHEGLGAVLPATDADTVLKNFQRLASARHRRQSRE